MEGKSKSPKKLPRKKIENYSTCMLFDAVVAQQKLQSITIAACNPSLEDDGVKNLEDTESDREPAHHHHKKKHVVSDKMNCNCCSVEFASRSDQRDHYKSDWHRYNIKLRLKEESTISEEEFEKISGDVSSISGSEGDSDLSDTETDTSLGGGKGKSKPVAIPSHLQPSAHSGTDSESEGGGILEVTKRKYPKIYFRNEGGELISLFRCLLFHKKRPPNNQSEIITLASSLPQRMKWAVFMAAGGHFAASIFDGEKILAHKTFHRYVVRAKRGSAQSSRDGQGNAPKSAGASLRRYNEAALAQDVQELISSWSELIKKCDLIFLRAPSFNRQIFYGGKNPSFKKDDFRIRTIPFPTRRPTLNEIKRVHQMLASIECYGYEADIQDFIPVSPMRQYSVETGRLEIIPEDKMQRSPRKSKNKDTLSVSPLTGSPKVVNVNRASPTSQELENILRALPDHLNQDNSQGTSSATSTASETELVEVEETISMLNLMEFDCNVGQKPHIKKKNRKKRRPSLKHQIEPDGDVYAEERYHLRNALYTACRVGDAESLNNLLAVFHTTTGTDKTENDSITDKIVTEFKDSSYNNNTAEVVEKSITDISDICTGGEESVFSCETDEVEITNCSDLTAPAQDQESEITIQECLSADDSHLDRNTLSESNILLINNGTRTGVEHNAFVEKVLTDKYSSIGASGTGGNNTAYKKPEVLPASLSLDKNKSVVPFELSPLMAADILNERFGDNGTTLLHVSAKAGYSSVVLLLLEAGADPSVKDNSGKVPFSVTSNRETRNEFRRFMGRFPDKFDYAKAQIPSPLTAEMEAERKQRDTERRKLQKKAKQEKVKVKKAETEMKKALETEKKKFLALSDREKRALAAEKRFVQQQQTLGAAVPVLSRCWQCGDDITGKVPFEYFDYKFCTPKCLQTHRKAAKS